ncbi:uncharacterized protein [Bemisia tabaci]|uniref:uncharacterized protein n=1 Tax=Bemisia tabaci TaxID=7038 RepID=UPI003B285BCA
MNIRILTLCVRLSLSITILTNVTSAVNKSNVTLDPEDEKSFFKRLRKKFQHSSSGEHEDSFDTVEAPSAHFGEALISHHLAETEEILKKDLEEYMKDNDNYVSSFGRYKTFMMNQMSPLVNNFIVHSRRDDSNDETKTEPLPDLLLGKKFREFYYRLQTNLKLAFTHGPGIPPTHEGYRRFMYRTFRPLLKQGYLVKSCKKTGSCKCDHLIVPKDNFGQFLFVMNYTVVEPEFKMVFEPMTRKGLARMKKFKMGCDLNEIYANARYKYRFFFLFSGTDIQMRYDKLF